MPTSGLEIQLQITADTNYYSPSEGTPRTLPLTCTQTRSGTIIANTTAAEREPLTCRTAGLKFSFQDTPPSCDLLFHSCLTRVLHEVGPPDVASSNWRKPPHVQGDDKKDNGLVTHWAHVVYRRETLDGTGDRQNDDNIQNETAKRASTEAKK